MLAKYVFQYFFNISQNSHIFINISCIVCAALIKHDSLINNFRANIHYHIYKVAYASVLLYTAGCRFNTVMHYMYNIL